MPSRIRSLLRFGMVGAANNSIVYVLFLVMIWFGVAPVVASGLCYCIAIATGYLANRYWSFEARSAHARDIPRYMAAYLIGLAFAFMSMWVLTKWMPPAYAQLICIVLTAFVVFGSLIIMRFGRDVHHADQAERT